MKRIVLVIVILGGIAAGVSVFAISGGGSEVTYLTVPVERGNLVTAIRATGTLKAVLTVKVGSQLSGQIFELFADFNDVVKKGQPIAQLDPKTFTAKVREVGAAVKVAEANVITRNAAIERAKADLANAGAAHSAALERESGALVIYENFDQDLSRKQPLQERGTISISALDEARKNRDAAAADWRGAVAETAARAAEILSAKAVLKMTEAELLNAAAQVEQKKATLEQVEIELERTVIRAPIDGVVIGRGIDRGQTVAASLEAPTLFVIAQDLKDMEVHAKIDEADIGRIRVGQSVEFTVDAFPRRRFAGEVSQIRKAPKTIQNVVIFTVVIATPNPDLILLPGMTASVRIVIRETRDVLKAPNTAFRFQPSEASNPVGESAGAAQPNLWILDNVRRPEGVTVEIGDRDNQATEIVSGPLKEGQQVIVGESVSRDSRSIFGLRLGF
ncbi:MAG: efflux RND transporter periplasmic adaptor subunit [Gammaproteobacteria bacterium]|nr:efflux RND transporter periplasmic adaptor subunit [Gammaproteobacteria bacterium]